MRPNELHDYLLNLKNKNSQDPNIAEYKRTIREELRAYRSDQPSPPLESLVPYPSDGKDVVFYSFMEAKDKPKIGEHEYKRLKLSWSSLRKHNTDIEIRFCYNGDAEEGLWPSRQKWLVRFDGDLRLWRPSRRWKGETLSFPTTP